MSRTASTLCAAAVCAACAAPVNTYRLAPEPRPALQKQTTHTPQNERLHFENPGGMWLPAQLRANHAEELRRLGLEIDPEQLSDPMAYPLGAVVSLGGCSASFVSADGLVITNHHCVTGALQQNSTPQNNLLQNGYLAATREDEKSVGPTGRVFVTQAFTDVTERVRLDLDRADSDQSRYLLVEKRMKEIVAGCEQAKPNVRCDVVSYFGGAQYLLIEKLELKDVRLVYAPHAGIGDFGGDIDNWRWPRHGGDFAFYRAYVNKDGKPSAFDAANVPYHPTQYLKIASRPLAEHDLVLVAGYPGRTYRLQTQYELEEAIDWWYPRRIRYCEEYLQLLGALSKNDPEVKLKAAPLDQGLNNSLIYTRGALEGLTKGGAAAQKRKLVGALGAWINADPERKARYERAFGKLDEIFAERARLREQEAALDELLRMSSLLSSAMTIVRMAEERPKPDAERKPDYQARNWESLEQAQRALEKRYSRKLDRALLAYAVERAERLPPSEYGPLLDPFSGPKFLDIAHLTRAIERAYATTTLENTAVRVKLLKTASSAELKASRDPFIRLALGLRPLVKAKEDREEARSGALVLWRPLYVNALREFSAQPIAPDANGTLRVTYGTVRGYRPSPSAAIYRPFTVVSEMVRKNTGKEPFNAPERVIEAARSKKFGPYVDPTLGEVPLDFLADLDITGGNSGSPTLNSRGELVGLAFDGNYEAMASDWLFMPNLSRSIHVDIRYALWIMDAVDGAQRLLDEMGVRPAFAPAESPSHQ